MSRRVNCSILVAGLTVLNGAALGQGGEPVLIDAVQGVLKAFDRYDVVAVGEGEHEATEFYDFYFALIEHPDFPSIVDDIVFEAANAIHQPLIDRFVSGGDASMGELRRVWRDATNCPEGDSPLYEAFFTKVREVNSRLPASKRIRVLAGDPAFDWNDIRTTAELSRKRSIRDLHYAQVVIDEVLEKGRKALLLMGNAHFYQDFYRVNDPNIRKIVDKRFPNSMCVIDMHGDETLNRRSASWPTPSIAWVKDTWIGALPVSPFNPDIRLEDDIEAIIHLGPAGSLRRTAANSFPDGDPYWPEYECRRKISSANPVAAADRNPTLEELTPKKAKKAIVSKLFEIVEAAKQEYQKAIRDGEETTFRDSVHLEKFNDPELRFYFEKEEDNEGRDGLVVKGMWVSDWETKAPKVVVTAFISKKDLAIQDVKYF